MTNTHMRIGIMYFIEAIVLVQNTHSVQYDGR